MAHLTNFRVYFRTDFRTDNGTVLGMGKLDGANVPQALQLLQQAGDSALSLAEGLSVTRQTVRRWMQGRHRPSTGNFARLVQLVDNYGRSVAAVDFPTARQHEEQRLVAAAREALVTDQERAARAELEARVRADRDRMLAVLQGRELADREARLARQQQETWAREARREQVAEAETPQQRQERLQRVADQVNAKFPLVPQQRTRSVTTQVDAFDLAADGDLEPAF